MRRILATEEAGGQERKLAKEDVDADLPEEQAVCGLRGESSPLSLSLCLFMWTGLFISLFPLFSHTLCAQFLSLPGLVLVSHSSCTYMSMDSKSS
jgi:hypothetical protein